MEIWRYEDLEVTEHAHGWLIEGRWLLKPIGPFDTKENAERCVAEICTYDV